MSELSSAEAQELAVRWKKHKVQKEYSEANQIERRLTLAGYYLEGPRAIKKNKATQEKRKERTKMWRQKTQGQGAKHKRSAERATALAAAAEEKVQEKEEELQEKNQMILELEEDLQQNCTPVFHLQNVTPDGYARVWDNPPAQGREQRRRQTNLEAKDTRQALQQTGVAAGCSQDVGRRFEQLDWDCDGLSLRSTD